MVNEELEFPTKILDPCINVKEYCISLLFQLYIAQL